MYEEQGLLVEIFPKTSSTINEMVFKENAGNVILDFEQAKEGSADMKFGEKVYIPIFKKAWESPGNLDIAVPIGYNTVIVRINKTEPKSFGLDKFERAFYDKE